MATRGIMTIKKESKYRPPYNWTCRCGDSIHAHSKDIIDMAITKHVCRQSNRVKGER